MNALLARQYIALKGASGTYLRLATCIQFESPANDAVRSALGYGGASEI